MEDESILGTFALFTHKQREVIAKLIFKCCPEIVKLLGSEDRRKSSNAPFMRLVFSRNLSHWDSKGKIKNPVGLPFFPSLVAIYNLGRQLQISDLRQALFSLLCNQDPARKMPTKEKLQYAWLSTTSFSPLPWKHNNNNGNF